MTLLHPDQSNLPKEDKTTAIYQSEAETMITKSLTATNLGSINHNLDLCNQTCQEDVAKFNVNTILLSTIGSEIYNTRSKNNFRVICKIGYGGFSVVWLVIDTNTKEFKVAKVFKYGYGITDQEIKTLQQTSSQPNILRYYESVIIEYGAQKGCIAIYEPLGKDLNMLTKEAAKHGGLSIRVVKKVAKHVLLALKTIHDLKIVHSDIKLHNIAPYVSQLSLRIELENIIKSKKYMKSFYSLRMVCDNFKYDENKVRKMLKNELDEVSKLEIEESTELVFKLIDFGNALEEGTLSSTGTYGFRPPEYFFGAPLLPSHDIWSLGVTIIVLLTNNTFLEYGKAKKIDEITALRNMFGKFSRRNFKGFKDPRGYKTKFTTRCYNRIFAKRQLIKVLQKKINKLQMDENDRKDLIDFLLQMLDTIPTERKSAAELLYHSWLNVVETGAAQIGLVDMARDDRYEPKLNFEEDGGEYGTDSDLDETEEDSNKTISEFGSGESYVEGDASYAPSFESFSDNELEEMINRSDIS